MRCTLQGKRCCRSPSTTPRVNRGGCLSTYVRLRCPGPCSLSEGWGKWKFLHMCNPDAQAPQAFCIPAGPHRPREKVHKPGYWTDKTMPTFLELPWILNSYSCIRLTDNFLIDTHSSVKKKKKNNVLLDTERILQGICSNWQLLLSYGWFRSGPYGSFPKTYYLNTIFFLLLLYAENYLT